MFFNKKHNLIDIGFFKGFTDCHSHILFGVDDGCCSLDKSLKVLEYYEELGITRVFLTPHVMKDYPNTAESLERVFDELKSEYKGEIELNLAAEYMGDNGIYSYLDSRMLTFNGNRVLVENSYFAPMQNFKEILYDVAVRGYTPVVAHPERYMYYSLEDYVDFVKKGYELQLNILSLSDYYGKEIKEKALIMLRKGLYSYLGTDIHSRHKFISFVKDISLNNKDINLLKQLNKFNINCEES